MTTHARRDNLHSGMAFTRKPGKLVKTDVKKLMDSERFETQLAAIKPNKRARVTPVLQRRRLPKLQRQDKLLTPPVGRGGFRKEPGTEVEGASNGLNRSPSGKVPLDVQTSLGKAHGESVSLKYREERVSNTFQEIRAEQQGYEDNLSSLFVEQARLDGLRPLRRPRSKKKLERFDEELNRSLKAILTGP
ncbi:hypothetical protein AYI70_g322 [Smittium culicis]|uniref:Uncharacterized protein n=1 Tax=Smittium culicis TaxID=133412 RepID=A0A1R1YH52_9FUNG|nr:hypothetical protein AYI70_g322 [Smittium culicis]